MSDEKAPREAERWAASRAGRSASSYVGAADTGEDVTAELDRLRAELAQMRDAVDVRAVAELADERDRLRAVVEHLREMAGSAIDEDDRDDEYDEGNVAAWTYVRNVIDGKAGPATVSGEATDG